MPVTKEHVIKWLKDSHFRREVFFKSLFRILINRTTLSRERVDWGYRYLLYIDPDTIRLANQMFAAREVAPASCPTVALQVTILQTCDVQNYFPLLSAGRVANEQYAIKNGFDYGSYVGIKRGYYPWHASFNRLFMLKELADIGYRGWVFYIDADAYIRDQSFDLRQYLESHQDKYLIAATGGVTEERWELNDGVFLINLGHPNALRLIDLWHWHFMATPDEALRLARDWDDVTNDQTRLHDILRANPYLIEHIHVENYQFQDLGNSGFVRQVMRQAGMTLDDRIAEMRNGVAALNLLSHADSSAALETK